MQIATPGMLVAKPETGAWTDPVCGMEVDEKLAAAAGRKLEYQGKAYYFCSDECKETFEKDPARYAKK